MCCSGRLLRLFQFGFTGIRENYLDRAEFFLSILCPFESLYLLKMVRNLQRGSVIEVIEPHASVR